jgi:cation-transporting ATPase 13A3/4/5
VEAVHPCRFSRESPSAVFQPANNAQRTRESSGGVLSADLVGVRLDGVSDCSQHSAKYFFNKKQKYCWSTERRNFEKLRGPEFEKSCSFFHQSSGLSCEQQSFERQLYGENNIRVHVTPILTLLYTQVLNPFYIFQVFSCLLWFLDQYYYFASCIILISVISIIVQIRETRETQRTLKNTITSSEITCVFRSDSGEYEDIESDSLVPGDIIEIPRNGCVLQCDAVLINGNCIVNESMLTG